MKLRIIIDKEREEEILIYAHERTDLIRSIEKLIAPSDELTAYSETDAVKLTDDDIFCFISENGNTYAITQAEKLKVRLRLYQLEERLGNNFIRLNQSCIGNVSKMKRFESGFSGSLTVVFKNGYKDYVSRRQLKAVKERLGI